MAKKKGNVKKIFVIDTNVLLHNYKSVYSFEENDVVIPIVVLEELDNFKKGTDLINFHAREFTRELDHLSGEDLFTQGVKLGDGLGKLYIENGKGYSEIVRNVFHEKTPDHRILSITLDVIAKNPGSPVILISKDINLRMKAKSLGIMAQDYENDKIANIDALNKDITTLENVNPELIARLYASHDGIAVEEFNLGFEPEAHQYFILRGLKSSILAHYAPKEKVLNKVEKTQIFGIEPRNAEQTFSLDALIRKDIQLIALTGKAGTGKTLLALAAALSQHKIYDQILLARPIVALGNKDLGFLPGDAKDKIGPYMLPLFDNLTVIKNKFKQQGPENAKIDELLKTEKLLISPLAYIRGRSLSNVFFIVDEAQNLTPHEIKTIITRAGEGSKFVFTGDIQQIDSPYLDSKSNGLSYLTDKMMGQDMFAHVNLVKGERSRLADLASDLL
ncbi:MAG TPA: ribonuclease [Bacteroidales bacterium]|nr:MAG: phosphate starvation-inducible protein PhoH [Bacteroidetes bacterium GWF2_33_38]OFY90816.1 MAG: phosphate starvation-inducible protein PhoH [Bacteroidetes bacterium RIFOXYA2_FULL_33_7]HBF87605.1 ribonuclease [Bacteroidales bacterium]